MSKKDVQNDDIEDTLDEELNDTIDTNIRSNNAKQYVARKRLEALREEAELKQLLDFESYAFDDLGDDDG